MKYTTTKLSLAMSLEKNMSKEVLEEEFDGSKTQLLNYLLWGDKHAQIMNKQNLLQHEYMYDEEENPNGRK